MVCGAILRSDPESCLVIPDLSKQDLKQFYEHAFRGSEVKSCESIRNVATTLSVDTLTNEKFQWAGENVEFDEDDSLPDLFDCLKKSDKIKLSQYFCHNQDEKTIDKLSSVEVQLKPFQDETYHCHICHRTFSEAIQLDRHKNTVHLRKPKQLELNKRHKCPHCNKRFDFHSNIKKHIWLVHKHDKHQDGDNANKSVKDKFAKKREKMEDIICKICNKFFSSWKKLQLHILDHTDDRPFCCSECGKGFKEESKLKRHSLIHSGLKPFNCSYCDKTFSLKHNKDIHERLHTGTGYECEYCGEIFSQKVNLMKHNTKHAKLGHVKTKNSNLMSKQSIVSSKGKMSEDKSNGSKKLFVLDGGSKKKINSEKKIIFINDKI